MSLPTLYTPKEVAELWKVTRRTVYDWIKTGRIKAYKIGDTVRIPESELMAFIKPVEPVEPSVEPTTSRRKSEPKTASARKPPRKGRR